MPVIKYSEQFRAELLKKFEEYIEDTEVPLIEEFALWNGIPKSNLYNFEEFDDVLKKATEKTKINHIRTMIETKNGIVSAVRMFLLKTMYGFRESTPIQIDTGDNKYLTINLTGKTTEELQDLAVKQLRQGRAGKPVKQGK